MLDRAVGQWLTNNRRPEGLGNGPVLDRVWNPGKKGWTVDWQRHHAHLARLRDEGVLPVPVQKQRHHQLDLLAIVHRTLDQVGRQPGRLRGRRGQKKYSIVAFTYFAGCGVARACRASTAGARRPGPFGQETA
ncbi:hypothetical protein NJL88_04715 [Streptomyces sp. DK15]|uniref:hypothetical protein n=1 Tax=Streptomyces sp. DK15 TaxID=2957499 RepID=UPI0029B87016|nr:hypothetical protein [Streptomyces sp. DK15]MDX2389390.1 hypothetical protein [Streptomyces sp. DK15]